MAGYLDEYGAGEERRSHIIKTIAVIAVAVLVVGGGLLWYFHTYSQEREVRRFLALLSGHDYQAAYRLWGCSEAKPCKDYPIGDFMNDWGPQAVPNPGAVRITSAETCGSGAIVTVGQAGAPGKALWVEDGTGTLGFSPVALCPGRSPMKIMLSRLRDHLR